LNPWHLGNGPTKSIPIDCQGLNGMGRLWRSPGLSWLLVLLIWQGPQLKQNFSMSRPIHGHQNHRRAYSDVFWGPRCPTVECTKLITTSGRLCLPLIRDRGTHRHSSPSQFLVWIRPSCTRNMGYTVRPTWGGFHHANGDSCDLPHIKVISYIPVLS
jgi:hypothetical protein